MKRRIVTSLLFIIILGIGLYGFYCYTHDFEKRSSEKPVITSAENAFEQTPNQMIQLINIALKKDGLEPFEENVTKETFSVSTGKPGEVITSGSYSGRKYLAKTKNNINIEFYALSPEKQKIVAINVFGSAKNEVANQKLAVVDKYYATICSCIVPKLNGQKFTKYNLNEAAYHIDPFVLWYTSYNLGPDKKGKEGAIAFEEEAREYILRDH